MATQKFRDENREYIRAYRRKWYADNKKSELVHVVRRQEEIKEWFQEYKTTLKCSICPENDPICLDFHHRNPNDKDKRLSDAVRSGWSKKRILKEIQKCDVLCANCHRKLHRNER